MVRSYGGTIAALMTPLTPRVATNVEWKGWTPIGRCTIKTLQYIDGRWHELRRKMPSVRYYRRWGQGRTGRSGPQCARQPVARWEAKAMVIHRGPRGGPLGRAKAAIHAPIQSVANLWFSLWWFRQISSAYKDSNIEHQCYSRLQSSHPTL